MTSSKPTRLRCAIYTRKSSEEGLEQDFNSLHAQREACEAFILSQKHEGWNLIKTEYDDGGISGGTMERPALQRLLADIKDHKVDVVVVYKVDRLTRALADFARMVELFDAHSVSFVSVTQQFNTTTSMGRLTLNVLLSFAQFEREVTGERIRDKIAASKKKGMWMGGFVPLGYDVVDRKLVVNTPEAETVRGIYKRYLDLGCVRLLKDDLDRRGICSKLREQNSRWRGGASFSRGCLYKLLSNPIYIGQIRHKDACHPGQHEAIIAQELWEQVQQRLTDNRIGTKTRSHKTDPSPLADKLFDAASGERLVIVHAKKKGRRYRYYVLQSLTTGIRDNTSNGWRLPGQQIEQSVLRITQSMLNDRDAITTALQTSGIATHQIPAILNAASAVSKKIDSGAHSTGIMDALIQRVELKQDGIRITLSLASIVPQTASSSIPTITCDIPMQMKRRGAEMRLVIASNTAPTRMDHTLIKNAARASRWFEDLISGRVKNLSQIAARENINLGDVSRLLNLAFLAPSIVEALVAGKQPADLCNQKLIRGIDLPLDWEQQRRMLGFV